MNVYQTAQPMVAEIPYPEKIGWFDRWFMKKSKQAWENSKQAQNAYYTSGAAAGIAAPIGSNMLRANTTLDFQLIRAENGWILQFQRYSNETDRTHIKHHIISDGEDIGQAVSQILTLEAMSGKRF